jgi:hypothetical protein
MKLPFVRSLLVPCLLFASCAGGEPTDHDPETPELVPPSPPPPPAATAVSFACASMPVTFDLPCQAGVPLAGTISVVECTAHAGVKTGIVSLLVNLGASPNQVNEIVPGPVSGDFQRFELSRGSVVFHQVDTAKRTFVGRLQDFAFSLDGTGPCQLDQGPFSGVPGNFL